MHFGSTSLRVAGILAKGLHRPRLRSDLKISEQMVQGETSYMIQVPESKSFCRFGSYEYALLQFCDGTRTPAEITDAMNQAFPDQPLTQEEVVDWLDSVDTSFWERSLGEKNLAILEKIREERKQRVDSSNLLYIRFAAWDPNRTLDRIYPYLRWLYTPGFIVFSVLLYISTFAIVATDYVRIRHDTLEFYNFLNKTAYDIWIFWLILFFVSAVHEFGHGLTCKHYGGNVDQMGLLLIYFTPAFFTDCSEMYMFNRRSQRLWTIFAGIWIELVLCGLATLVWYFSLPGSFIGDLAYKTLLLTGVSGVFFNLNPLMPYDGYYALSQYLEIDSLRADAFDYVKLWLRRHLLRQDVELPPVGRRRRHIFLTYGILAFLYGLMVLTLVTLLVRNIFISRFGSWGYLMTLAVVYLILRKRLRKWWPGLKSGLRKTKEQLMAWKKMTQWQKISVAAVLLLILVPPLAVKTTSDFILEPGTRAEVRALVSGRVAEVRVREGENVSAGQVLAVLSNPDITARATVLRDQVALAQRSLGAARAQEDLAGVQRSSQDLQRLQAELAEVSGKQEELTLRSPIAGVVTTPFVDQRVGDYLKEGTLLATVADRHLMRARVLVRDWELEDVRVGAMVKLNLRSYPFRTFAGRVQQIMPAAALDQPVAEPKKLERHGQELTNFFAVVLEFPNDAGTLREGMTGTARIYGRRYPLAWRMARSSWRWLRSQVW